MSGPGRGWIRFRDSLQFECAAVSRACGAFVVLKVETANPIRSSAGNFGQGLAWAGVRRGYRVTVFAAQGANPLKVQRMACLMALCRVPAARYG